MSGDILVDHDEGPGLGSDTHRVLQDRIAQIHTRVPQAQCRGGGPASPAADQACGRCLDRYGDVEHSLGQDQFSHAHERSHDSSACKSSPVEVGIPVEPRPEEPCVTAEPRPVEPGIEAELRLVEFRVAAELHPTEPGLLMECRPVEPRVAAERCPGEPRVAGELRSAEPCGALELRAVESGVSGELCPVEPGFVAELHPVEPRLTGELRPAEGHFAGAGPVCRRVVQPGEKLGQQLLTQRSATVIEIGTGQQTGQVGGAVGGAQVGQTLGIRVDPAAAAAHGVG